MRIEGKRVEFVTGGLLSWLTPVGKKNKEESRRKKNRKSKKAKKQKAGKQKPQHDDDGIKSTFFAPLPKTVCESNDI